METDSFVANRFPRQDIPLIEKNVAWMKLHLDYAESVLMTTAPNRDRLTRLWNSYNGIKNQQALAWLERTYGKMNKAKYIGYRVGRTKLDLMIGEFLKRPLSSTIYTINSEAKSEKAEQMAFMLGAMEAKKEAQMIKEKAGVDVMEGLPIPDSEDDEIFKKMSAKDKYETIMQIILNNEIKDLDLLKKFSDCFRQLLVTGYIWAKIDVDSEGNIEFTPIDYRDSIVEEIEGDDYFEKSPVRGCKRILPVHEILRRYTLTQEQRNLIDAARNNPNGFVNNYGKSRGYMRMDAGQLLCDVIHIEWDSVEAQYYKISPKTNSQMIVDDETDSVRIQLNTEEYERNKESYDKAVAAGKFQIETKFMQVTYEATRIGGLIDVDLRKRPFQARNWDNPTKVLNSSYYGFRCGSDSSNVVISVQQIVENFDSLYDIIQYQKNRSIAHAKGKVLFYDRAGMPAGRKMRDILYQVHNDGFIDWNSAADGNAAGRNLDLPNAIKELDLGLSQSFQFLLAAEQNVLNQLDRVTGINENRQGDIAASTTATNANSAIQASRNITEPLYYGMDGFIRRVLQGVVDTSALTWAFYKTQKGEQILGVDMFQYLKVTKEVGYRNYGLHIESASQYMETKQILNQAMSISLNAKEITAMDFLKVNLAETMKEQIAILEDSVKRTKDAIVKSEEAALQMKREIAQQEMSTRIKISTEEREDTQVHDIDKINAQADADIRVNAAKTKGKIVENDVSDENKMLLNQQ